MNKATGTQVIKSVSQWVIWSGLTNDQKVQALLDAAAAINPAVQDVADTLVATINRRRKFNIETDRKIEARLAGNVWNHREKLISELNWRDNAAAEAAD